VTFSHSTFSVAIIINIPEFILLEVDYNGYFNKSQQLSILN